MMNNNSQDINNNNNNRPRNDDNSELAPVDNNLLEKREQFQTKLDKLDFLLTHR